MAACSSESGNTLNNPETCYHIRKQSYQKEFRTEQTSGHQWGGGEKQYRGGGAGGTNCWV